MKVLDEIDNWKKSQLDEKIRHNIEIANNSFGDMKEQYQSRAKKQAEQYYQLTGEHFKI